MLPKWLQSPRKTPHRPATSRRSPRYFSCSSFKDIQELLNEDLESETDSPKSPSVFHRMRSSSLRQRSPRSTVTSPKHSPVVVILYFTSLRVVRKTFEECRTVQSILRGFRVPIDERDLSMDAEFVEELKTIFGTKTVTLPRVFIGCRYIGGAEEIKQMQESGKLRKLIGELPSSDNAAVLCEVCANLRYAVCEQCNGSKRIYSEKSDIGTCSSCNVYGLIRCSSCCPSPKKRVENK